MLELHDAPGVEHAPPGHPAKCPGRVVNPSQAPSTWRLALETWPVSGSHARAVPGAYVGRRVSTLSVLGNRVSWASVIAWALGNRKPPPWANELMANHLEQKARHMLWIAAELRKEKPAR